MSKSYENVFDMDEYTRRTLAEKARLRQVGTVEDLRKKQQEMFDKYGKKWMRGIGKAIMPSQVWCLLAAAPVTLLESAVKYIIIAWVFITVAWRTKLAHYLMMGGIRHKVEEIRPGVRKLSIIVKGEVVEEVEVKLWTLTS